MDILDSEQRYTINRHGFNIKNSSENSSHSIETASITDHPSTAICYRSFILGGIRIFIKSRPIRSSLCRAFFNSQRCRRSSDEKVHWTWVSSYPRELISTLCTELKLTYRVFVTSSIPIILTSTLDHPFEVSRSPFGGVGEGTIPVKW